MEKLILECVVRSLLIGVCTAVALFVLRVKAARVRHAVWASVVALMLILPVWTAWGPKAVFRVLKPEPAIAYPQPTPVQQTVVDPDGPALPQRSEIRTLENAFLAAYLLGFCALMARLITGTLRVRNLTGETCAAPVTIGWLRPSVILPANSAEWSPEQLNAVLIHEDEHARHRDPLVQWLALLNRAIFWFHPLAWWLERKLSALAEEACDDAVLTQGHDPIKYSECLLKLARIVQQAGGMAMARTFLPQRIRRIANGTAQRPVSRSRRICLGVSCAAVSALFTTAAIGYQAALPASTPTPATKAQFVAAPASQSAPTPAESAPVSTPVMSPSLHWKPSWKGQGAQVLIGTVNGERRVAMEIPAKPTDGFGVGFQTLSVTVADPSGAVVPNATITLANTDIGAILSAVTGAQGTYQFDNIEFGNYSLRVKAPGFKTEIQNNIHVGAGQTYNAGRVILQVGTISESVSVSGSRSAAASMPPPAPEPFIKTLGPMMVLKQSPMPAPPPFKPEPQSVAGGPIRVGGNVQASKIISQIKPLYPMDALMENVAGTVKIEAIVTKEGTLTHVVLVNSPDPRLTHAALDAVRQWRYQPTLLDGEPVEVMTTIDVNYESLP